jgi:hypothetical protein
MFAPPFLARVNRQWNVLFDGIAATARIDQVVIVAALLGVRRSRANMVDAEGTVAIRTPNLSPKTIDATKAELVSQPRLERLVVRVAQRPV